MPRKRDLSPDVWGSEQFLNLPTDTARLLFLACFSLADDLGLGRVADLRRHTRVDVRELESVDREGLIHLFEVPDGKERARLYLVPKFAKHQYVNTPSKPKIPLPSCWRDLVPEAYHEAYIRSKCPVVEAQSAPVPSQSRDGTVTVPSQPRDSTATGLSQHQPSPVPVPVPVPVPLPIPSPLPKEEKSPDAAAAAPSSPDGADPSSPARKGKRAHREPEPPSAEALGIAHELRAAIREHTPDFKGPRSLDAWGRDIDKALRMDGRTAPALLDMIAFAHRDPRGEFWRSNVLSGATLRKQADRLAIEAKRPATNGRASSMGPAMTGPQYDLLGTLAPAPSTGVR